MRERETPRSVRRGYDATDEERFSGGALLTLSEALGVCAYLLERGFPLESSVTFVGNRYRLSARQRLCLLRSAATKAQVEGRRAKELSSLEGRRALIDGFNIIITLETLFSGSLVYRAMDSTIKDLAGLRGSYRPIERTRPVIRLILSHLLKQRASGVLFLFDAQVSNSGLLSSLVREEGDSLPVEAGTERDVDRFLFGREAVVTSDGVILDHCKSWYNLTGALLGEAPSPFLVDLRA